MLSRLINFPASVNPNVLKIINFAWFQCVWWLLILFQSQAVVGVLCLMVFWLWLTPKVKSDATLILTLMVIGILVDSTLMNAGVFIFENYSNHLVIPFWLALLWGAYAATLQHSMGVFEGKPWLCVVAGAIAAPLSYLGGAKLGAVEFGFSTSSTVLVLALVWSVVFPISFVIVQRIQQLPKQTPA